MPQEQANAPDYQSPFPDPWQSHGVDGQDYEDMLQLYVHVFLQDMDTFVRVLDKLTISPDSQFGKQYVQTQGADAYAAAIFFLVSDFLAMKYFRFHPKLEMKPIPKEVLPYLRYPYNKMTSLAYEDQKRFRDSLPPEHRGDVYIDE
jgi:hypothetical protein